VRKGVITGTMRKPRRLARRRKQVSRAAWQVSHTVWPSAAEAVRRTAGRAFLPLRRLDEPSSGPPLSRVIFACMHNAGRSQMAAAFFNLLADPVRARAIAAGTRAGQSVDPTVLEAMREIGLDLGPALARRLNAPLAMAAGRLVTMGCQDDCPFYPGVTVEDWPIDDPRGQSPERVREIRDVIRRHVEQMIERQGWGRT
jgi:arsenate reductase (thioredoxin)